MNDEGCIHLLAACCRRALFDALQGKGVEQRTAIEFLEVMIPDWRKRVGESATRSFKSKQSAEELKARDRGRYLARRAAKKAVTEK